MPTRFIYKSAICGNITPQYCAQSKQTMLNFLNVLALFALLSAAAGAATGQAWWETASFYQIYPRSFKDSDGNGIGDLKCITQQLPYLKEIGIDATWLSPIFTSPMADFGYDVSNFTEIDKLYGTLEDFQELLAKANQLGVRIIFDFVPNHSSDECEWFIKSVKSDPEYKDFYIWHPGKISENGTRVPPNNWISNFRGSAWTWNEDREEVYLHQFHAKQPDLIYNNPKVRELMKDVLRYWVRLGVAGFRIDAVPHIYEVAVDADGNYPDEPRNPEVDNPESYLYLEHIYTRDQPETLEVVFEFRQVLKELDEELGGDEHILMAEICSSIDVEMQYYGNTTTDGVQIPFNFELLNYLDQDSNGYLYSEVINKWLDSMPEGRVANWVLGNHDQSRIGTRLGADRIDLINLLLKTLPGVSVTYQGEEIGMTDVWISWEDTVDPQGCQSNPEEYQSLSRDPPRTPFHWNDGHKAGFTEGNTTWLPLAEDYRLVNVKRERGIAYSHLNVYKRLQDLRVEKTLRDGETEVKAINANILGIKRYLTGERTFVVLLNINNAFETIDLNATFNDLPNVL
ncbi:PREDICTED: maltase A3-like [Rhagoletis zephyria]|uniref:maltase A3-like n=1 Tax=Rhagoletis zephyria TaxID=28612 RepID=UPI0008118C88|nr:PREDICTED: maltase A3-like [Rhagoletis zephyria]